MNILEKLNREDRLPLYPTDVYYRELVPKNFVENLAFRRFCLLLGYRNTKFAREIWQICARDILFYVNTFVWTHSPKDHPDQPIRPFITYPYQDLDLRKIEAAIGHYDISIAKSRDMGATWLCEIAIEHKWHFSSNQAFLMCSRKQEFVDQKGNMKALFQKMDFIHSHQPLWLLPTGRSPVDDDANRIRNHLGNADNGSSIDGEATVRDLARGDRLTAILLDEHASMSDATEIEKSTRDATRCRIKNSTPRGRYGAGSIFYSSIMREWKRDPTKKNPKLILQHWSDHPEKGKGLYRKIGDRKEELSSDYCFLSDFPFIGEARPRSPWYDEQCERATSQQEIAQELDIDFVGSSERFANDVLIANCREKCRPPVARGRVGVNPETFDVSWIKHVNGPFLIWCPFGGVEPPVSNYSAGVDLSAGTGGKYTSNSAIVILDCRSGELAARFVTNSMRPEAFARFCIGVCKWFHGALLVPEINGPNGSAFMQVVQESGYQNVYRRDVEILGVKKKVKKWGYFNRDRGTTIMGALQDAMGLGQCTVYDEMILDELLEYEWGTDGKIFHAGSRSSESQSDSQMTHGDVAIASACAWLGVPEFLPDRSDSSPAEIPNDCPHTRFMKHDKQKGEESSDFNF